MAVTQGGASRLMRGVCVLMPAPSPKFAFSLRKAKKRAAEFTCARCAALSVQARIGPTPRFHLGGSELHGRIDLAVRGMENTVYDHVRTSSLVRVASLMQLP